MTDDFDVVVVAELRELLGDDLDGLLQTFRDDAAARLQAARTAWRRHDLVALAHLAHSLKGAAANLGARRLARACDELEASARAGDGNGGRDDPGNRLDVVAAELGRCLEAFSGWPYRL